jgi:hypothetical protein
MSDTEREPGFYRIRFRESPSMDPDWEVAKWTGREWWIAGVDETALSSDSLAEIGERVEMTPRSTNDAAAQDEANVRALAAQAFSVALQRVRGPFADCPGFVQKSVKGEIDCGFSVRVSITVLRDRAESQSQSSSPSGDQRTRSTV